MTDADLVTVQNAWLHLDPDGTGVAEVMRETFDTLYDGQRSGRYRLDQLSKTEKAHFGSILEIYLQRRFDLDAGDALDFKMDGVEADCKFSHTSAWMLPPEVFDRLALLFTADDEAAAWSMGIIRVTSQVRRAKGNRDMKSSLSAAGKQAIVWIFSNHPMRPNVLLAMDRGDVDHMMQLTSGQKRINQLFRLAEGQRVTRNVIATVGKQADYMKRVRSNGGSRSHLASEGYILLSGDFIHQRTLADQLGVDPPLRGEVVSIRVVPDPHGVPIDDRAWRRARPGESVSPAPIILQG